ncbi:MAG: hypothetical protein ACYC9X_02915 [Dehalococcoidia bacterium]
MWSEPLTAGSADRNDHDTMITVRDGQGRAVAAVLCGCNRQTRTGFFGTMEITAPGGSPRQRIRALVLLVREALRTADAYGLTHVRTEAPARLLPFAERMSNIRGRALHADRYDLAGDLATTRTHALDTSDADGNLA